MVELKTTQSDLNFELTKLDHLLNDPDFYLDEYCHLIQNEIDIYFEYKLKTLRPDDDETESAIQKKRELCLIELDIFKERCLSVLFTTYKPIIKKFGNIEISDNLDELIIHVKTKIQAMKQMIRNFNDCTFDIEREIVVSPI